MFTHDDIWTAIDRLAAANGLSASGLARQAGLDATAFNRSKRISPNGKPRWPSTESIAKILEVTDATMMELFALIDMNDGTPPAVPLLSYASVRAGKLTAPKNHDVVRVAFKAGDNAFAVTIEDSRMSPLFRNGAVVVADPDAKIRADDRVLLYARKDGMKGGIVRSTGRKGYTILLPGDEFREETYADDRIEWVARILWSSH